MKIIPCVSVSVAGGAHYCLDKLDFPFLVHVPLQLACQGKIRKTGVGRPQSRSKKYLRLSPLRATRAGILVGDQIRIVDSERLPSLACRELKSTLVIFRLISGD